MIPKVIHYCWFGRNPLPPLAERCIESWKQHCPDYEFVLWNEDNFDLNCCDFIREAYAEKKWAFVSDAARLFIIYEHGGVYLDTDVELRRSLDDILSSNTFFYGIETQTIVRKHLKTAAVNTGLGFGAVKYHPTVKAMLDMYSGVHFSQNGVLDMTPCPQKNSAALRTFGFTGEDRLYQFLGGTIYPSEYFCPQEHMTGVQHYSKNTVSVHHYSESWVTPRVKYWMELYQKFKQYLPDKVSHYLASYISYIVYDGFFKGHMELLKMLRHKIRQKFSAHKQENRRR